MPLAFIISGTYHVLNPVYPNWAFSPGGVVVLPGSLGKLSPLKVYMPSELAMCTTLRLACCISDPGRSAVMFVIPI